ncbi:hypothetical protein NPIL_451871 [Nephila pilipes]|uniref:TWiK family of potassium channels protein 7 n=1 Tax=Nephila pilipes TaxID=299642 RepID=A0A8X6Q6I2_NEPPI|nr:hypothetical protein NPIL_451871 [Nephila pilipes]
MRLSWEKQRPARGEGFSGRMLAAAPNPCQLTEFISVRRQRQLSCYEEPYRSLFSVADYECECWRTDPALTGGAGVPTAISTPPCVLEMTLDSTLKKNKKKQKPPKKSKPSSASPGRCRRCCGRFTTFLFSHVGLCALVIGYSIMGAFAFRALEAPYEEQKASQVGHLRQETVRRLWEITDKLNVLYKDNWTELVEAEVRRFQKELIVAVKEGYDGKEGSGQQWSFSGAFLYSLTVITTIEDTYFIPYAENNFIKIIKERDEVKS